VHFPFLWSLENQKEISLSSEPEELQIEPNQHAKMTPNPENLMKITGYAHSSDDEQSALSHINLVKAVDGLTETPGCRPAMFRTISRARSKSESEVSAAESVSIKSVDDDDDVASTTSQDHGPYAPINDPIKPGDRVVVKNKYAGTCRYVGPIKEKRKSSESFVGVELDQKMTRFGGVFGSKKYFDCPTGHGIMVTFKNVQKLTRVPSDYVSDESLPEIVELAPFSKTTRTISRKTFNSGSRTSSHDSNDTHFDLKSFVNDKGWKVSNGYEKTKLKHKSSSLQHTRRGGRNGSGTMEILENFKSMQDEFRSLPAHLNEDEVEQPENYFDPRKFYKFKPFYFHEDLGPMRCNLGKKNVSIDCPNPEWDQMRQSFEMITKQKTVSMQSADSAYDGGDPMMSKYYTSSSSASSRRSSSATQDISSSKTKGNKLKTAPSSSRQAPKILPIRIRRYYEKETDSSGICDSDGSTGNKQKAVVKCQNYQVVPIEKRRRSSKSSSKSSSSSSRSKSLTNRKISPKAAEMSQHIVLNVLNSTKMCCSGKSSKSSKLPKESILKSFSILNRDCDANRSTCDECGAAKLSDLGRISKGKPTSRGDAVDGGFSEKLTERSSSHNSEEPSRARDTVALMSDTDWGGDSLEMDDVIIGFDQLSARTTKSNQPSSSSPKSDMIVIAPNICEKWAEKHGQALTPAMQKGIKKLEAALV